MSIYELYQLRETAKQKNDIEMVEELDRFIEESLVILETTSATGGAASGGATPFSGGVALGNATTAGMGPVQSSQPAALPGALNGKAWASGGGTEGSGDISVPYNPSGANRTFQKIEMGKNHGARTGKKSRQKKIDLKSIQQMLKKKAPAGKVMDFDKFTKSHLKDVTKVEN